MPLGLRLLLIKACNPYVITTLSNFTQLPSLTTLQPNTISPKTNFTLLKTIIINFIISFFFSTQFLFFHSLLVLHSQSQLNNQYTIFITAGEGTVRYDALDIIVLQTKESQRKQILLCFHILWRVFLLFYNCLYFSEIVGLKEIFTEGSIRLSRCSLNNSVLFEQQRLCSFAIESCMTHRSKYY